MCAIVVRCSKNSRLVVIVVILPNLEITWLRNTRSVVFLIAVTSFEDSIRAEVVGYFLYRSLVSGSRVFHSILTLARCRNSDRAQTEWDNSSRDRHVPCTQPIRTGSKDTRVHVSLFVSARERETISSTGCLSCINKPAVPGRRHAPTRLALDQAADFPRVLGFSPS